MKINHSIRILSLVALFLAPLPSSAAEPATGNAALTPSSLTKGTVMKLKAATTTFDDFGDVDDPDLVFTGSSLKEESLTWKTSTSYGDPEGNEFSCVYKKIDNFTAQITFKQTKAAITWPSYVTKLTGKYILLFTSYDKATNTLYGTMVKGDKNDVSGPEESFLRSSTSSGIFSLKIK